MDLRRALSCRRLSAKTLQVLLIGVFLLAAQPRLDFAADERPNPSHKIVALDDFVDALTLNRGGRGDDARNHFQLFLGYLPAFFVVEEFIAFTAKRSPRWS